MGFDFIDISIKVQTDNMELLAASLPDSGTDFAAACRTVACHKPLSVCSCCSAKDECGWHLVFSQGLALDPVAQKRHQKPPLPFAFTLLMPEEACESAGVVELRLNIAGRAIHFLGMLLEGLAELFVEWGGLLNCQIVEIESRDFQGVRQCISGKGLVSKIGSMPILSSDWIFDSCSYECRQFQLILLSPLKLISNGRQVSVFDFSLFTRSILRRVSSIAYYYGDYDFDVDFKALVRQLSDVICVEDRFCHAYTSGANSRINGIVGSGIFEGNWGLLLPFLVFGTYFNAGKKAAYGMGSYNICYKPVF